MKVRHFARELRNFQQALKRATDTGVLDVIKSQYSDPDTVTKMCDGVAAVAQELHEDRMTTNLSEVLVLDLRKSESVIAAGPIVKQPATVPFRVVLRCNGNEFVVHDESWNDYDIHNGQLVLLGQSGFTKGDYIADLPTAIQRFAERLAEFADFAKSAVR